jgi:hypothetical protein
MEPTDIRPGRPTRIADRLSAGVGALDPMRLPRKRDALGVGRVVGERRYRPWRTVAADARGLCGGSAVGMAAGSLRLTSPAAEAARCPGLAVHAASEVS